MDLNLQDKIVLITGGSRGIGESIARHFVAEGAHVVIADISKERSELAVAAIGSQASYVHMDVTNEESVNVAVKETLDKYQRIDILINNAGKGSKSDFTKLSSAKFQEVFAVNMFGTFLVTRAVVPSMLKYGKGKIVNIAALSATKPLAGYAHYSASKAAVVAFTRALADEYAADHLNINCISPGAVDTKLWESMDFAADILTNYSLGRAQKLEDIANMACYLSSDLAINITGHNFFVAS